MLFNSEATNLVPGDTNGTNDLFLKDLTTGMVTLVSSNAAGQAGNGVTDQGLFTADGSKVVFGSYANNLVAGDTNRDFDIFLKDLTTGSVTLVSANASGTVNNMYSISPAVAPDNIHVAFTSFGKNLVSGDTNNVPDIFIKNTITGAIERVSTNAAGQQANGESQQAVFSPDGSKIAFVSYADNLVDNDTNDRGDIFVKEATGVVTLVSTNSAGQQANSISSNPLFSPDGSKILFLSEATDLVDGDTNSAQDIFIKDLVTGETTLVSSTISGQPGNFASGRPVFSNDGTKIAFFSAATNLTAHDKKYVQDIFIKDLITGAVSLITVNSTTIGDYNDFPHFSFDDNKLVFQSNSSTLVSGDTNNYNDIFIVTLQEDGIIKGTGSQDHLNGRDTPETFYAGAGHDSVHANGGDDTVYGGGGDDRLYGGAGNDALSGNSGADRLYGEAGDDALNGNSGDDIFAGHDGNDVLDGGHDNDLLYGGAGDDVLKGGNGNDFLWGGSGDDTLSGGAQDDVLNGDGGRDILHGGDGHDMLYGGGSSDRLYGDGGDDMLYGGTGTNWLIGGAGADGFAITADSFDGTPDKIADFNAAEGDFLYLDHILTGFDAANDPITAYLSAAQSGTDTLLSVDRDGAGNVFMFETVFLLKDTANVHVDDLYASGNIIVA